MTAAEKQKTAAFLDLAADFIGSGYRGAPREYNFTDDAPPKPAIVPYPATANSAEEKQSPSPAATEAQTAAPVANSGNRGGDSLEQIAEEIRACENCPLSATRTNAAPGEGVAKPLVMVIGEGPGAEEDAQGRPFVGKAGQLLDKMLASINLSRNTNCFIANVVKCRPPENRDPHPEETAACAHFLQRQIAILQPKFILVAGRIAAQTLLKTSEGIGKLRRHFYDYETQSGTIPLLVTYHPAALLRNEDLKRPSWEDLKLLRSKIDN